MKIFRWGGLIGFTVFTAIVLIVGFFFLDSWMKKAIESAGYSVNGAEVNVGSVDLSLSPLGFRLQDIAISDADKLSHNLVEMEQAQLTVNLPQLFLGNTRITNLTVAGLKFDTERSLKAKVKQTDPTEEPSEPSAVENAVSESVDRVKGSLPQPANVVTDATDETKAAISNAENTLKESKQNVDAAAKSIPGDKELKAYKTRIADVKALPLNSIDNLQKIQKSLKTLSADLVKDKLTITNAEAVINKSVKASKKSVGDILKAPAKDWAQLKKDYPFNKESAVKVAQMLLGDSLIEKIETAKKWYGKAEPWLAKLKPDEETDGSDDRLSGRFVRFDHPNPTPNFLLDTSLFSFEADGWPWQLKIETLTGQQNITKQPIHVFLQRGEGDSPALVVNGELDRRAGAKVDSFNINGAGINFKGRSIDLAGSKMVWQPEPADIEGNVVITDGILDGIITIKFAQNKFLSEGDTQTARLLNSAFKKLNAFDLIISVKGKVLSPSISVTSDLDNKLSSALKNVAKAEYDSWLKSVKSELDNEVGRLRAPVDDQLNKLTGQQKVIEKKVDRFEKEVVAEVDSLKAKVNKELARLKDEKAKLEAKAKAAAKAKIEAKAKEELDKLKGKIKF